MAKAKAYVYSGLIPPAYYKRQSTMWLWQAGIRGYSSKTKYSYNAAARVVKLLRAAYNRPNQTYYTIIPCHCNPAGVCTCGYGWGLVYKVVYTKAKGFVINAYWAITLQSVLFPGGVHGTAELLGTYYFGRQSAFGCAARFLLGLTQAQFNGTGAKWFTHWPGGLV